MKKIVTVLGYVVAVICFCACNKSNNTQVIKNKQDTARRVWLQRDYSGNDTITEKDIVNPEELFKEAVSNYSSTFIITEDNVDKILDIFPNVNNYDVYSLFDWHNKATKGLVKFFDSTYPNKKLDTPKKVEHIFSGTRTDINYRTEATLNYYCTLYGTVGETKSVLNKDSLLIKEIIAWQTLNKVLDKYIDNSVSIAWYGGNGQGPQIKYDKTIILKSRLMDLQRINTIYQHQKYTPHKLIQSSIKGIKNNFETTLKKQTKDIITKSKEMVDGKSYNYSKSDDSKTVKTIKQDEIKVLNALNDWLNVRDSLKNIFNDNKDEQNFIKSATELLDGITESIPCPTHG
ncbi:MAG: hypothetical protein IJ213_04865 [Bacteroidales bacterium]|nr:hypothetical protein [Bacteroidales bacterium]